MEYYFVVSSMLYSGSNNGTPGFIEQVNSKLKEGFELYGSPGISLEPMNKPDGLLVPGTKFYYQALIKK